MTEMTALPDIDLTDVERAMISDCTSYSGSGLSLDTLMKLVAKVHATNVALVAYANSLQTMHIQTLNSLGASDDDRALLNSDLETLKSALGHGSAAVILDRTERPYTFQEKAVGAPASPVQCKNPNCLACAQKE